MQARSNEWDAEDIGRDDALCFAGQISLDSS